MRSKIIAVNSIVVLIVGFFTFALLQMSLGSSGATEPLVREEATRALHAANAKLELDALKAERWLASQANQEAIQAVFKVGTPQARAEGATEQANRLRASARGQAAGVAVSLVALVDAQGLVLGRDGTNLMRGEDVGAAHPGIKQALAQASPYSELWVDARSVEMMLVSYAPVRDGNGQVLGLVILGSPLNDERLQRTSELTSGRELLLGISRGDQLEIKAKASSASALITTALSQAETKRAALATLSSARSAILPGSPDGHVLAAAPLGGYGDGQAVLISAAPSKLMDTSGLLWPIAGATCLGVLLVVVGGWLLGNYISRPIEQIEEGLLAILNGRADHRFNIEHAEVGGLVFRLNSLLNQLMGVAEEDSDDQGRPPKRDAANS